MTVTCVISLTRIRFLTGSRTLLIMSLLAILSVIIYCVFYADIDLRLASLGTNRRENFFVMDFATVRLGPCPVSKRLAKQKFSTWGFPINLNEAEIFFA